MNASDYKATLERLRIKGEIAAYSVKGVRSPQVELILIGKSRSDEVKELLNRPEVNEQSQDEVYYFLGGELRPGTGVIRRVGDRPEGPSGTLTCFLSSRDSQDLYFAAAGHVVTNFWKVGTRDVDGSIYVSRKGFPGTNSMRSLGDLEFRSDTPRRRQPEEPDLLVDGTTLDIAIVKLSGKFTVKQRTTCYGNFGDLLPTPPDAKIGDYVMKCGAEETHWTAAKVEKDSCTVWVYGPDDSLYELKKQVILKVPSEFPDDQPPKNPPKTPFGVSGDSGTMVVDRENKRPVGMLIAGSILDGQYVMTPISALVKYWEDPERNLVLLRG